PPLRTPPPVPLPDDVTPDQLRALSRLDEESVARLAELDEAGLDAHGAARLAGMEPGA
ncbi:acyltransferase, partial [Actinospica acidiphila]|nr:acyltransferase [Actinospica acidiphila]